MEELVQAWTLEPAFVYFREAGVIGSAADRQNQTKGFILKIIFISRSATDTYRDAPRPSIVKKGKRNIADRLAGFTYHFQIR